VLTAGIIADMKPGEERGDADRATRHVGRSTDVREGLGNLEEAL
jgi:hypothetical protein